MAVSVVASLPATVTIGRLATNRRRAFELCERPRSIAMSFHTATFSRSLRQR
jgi:hypothetical protein